MTSKQRRIQKRIRAWYVRQGRTLPWRLPVRRAGVTADPYRILLSEIMLQQTQVSRVLVKYPEFLRRFPSFRALARASRRSVIQAWRGMGYNNRAVRLHLLARHVQHNHRGKLPETLDELRELPGVGQYTAHAILSSVFGKAVPVVDVNVQRVLSRIFHKMPTVSDMLDEKAVWRLAKKLVPLRKGYDWNQALMDLGATICTARRPRCAECPVARNCASRHGMAVARADVKKREPSFAGVPNRIHRGKIVEVLRNLDDAHSIKLETLCRRLGIVPTPQALHWLTGVLKTLHRDGLVRLSGVRTVTVALA